jgi:hypothetical protein
VRALYEVIPLFIPSAPSNLAISSLIHVTRVPAKKNTLAVFKVELFEYRGSRDFSSFFKPKRTTHFSRQIANRRIAGSVEWIGQ